MNYLRLRLYIALRISAHRVWMAVKTRPRWSDWALAAGLLLAFSLLVLPLGLWSQWLTPEVALPWGQGWRLAGRVLIIPALTEEGFWRVLMLPHKTEILSPKKRWLVALPMLGLFVLMHVLSSLTLYPQGFPTFVTPLFLFAATLLGLICTLAYWASGSGWVPVAMHWLVVFVWLMFLGGYNQLGLGLFP
ncbi:CPBP family glutamic-type intramembrane protease [Phormidium sp. FACHB-1136]|uniref:CPBP family glutamic-type intramembrane protease n=1 Tax=Phormidium sp. FACHB-1136 TaxID=2692848 RepID=UPI0016881E07|nr:CPBP family glutamic-type intramembrane protease [Phormidium sp. FACHB-1136]MBD2424659.1 CPBP family intramembrane metalloprotease [Phormidium sp. FACHB-1136]